MLTIDGITYDVKCAITRKAEISASEISGLLLDGSYFNDVLGTYMVYDIELTHPLYDQNKYAALYEAVTAPVESHTFILPYNGDTVTLAARVTSVQDSHKQPDGGRKYWTGLKFTVTSNYPTKAMSLGEVIVAGRSALPPVTNPAIGDTYTYTASGWVPAPEYRDADAVSY